MAEKLTKLTHVNGTVVQVADTKVEKLLSGGLFTKEAAAKKAAAKKSS